MLPAVLAPAYWTRWSGAVSGARFAGAGSPWPVPFPPSPPPPVALHRYYGTVRLPGLVHRRRASLDFPTRPAALSATGEPRTSRFSCEVFPYVPGSSTAQDPDASRACDAPSAAFRISLMRRHPGLSFFRGSIARPARTPVNASALPLRETPHDSGPSWVASPSTCDSFIHYTPPVYPGAFRNQREAILSAGGSVWQPITSRS